MSGCIEGALWKAEEGQGVWGPSGENSSRDNIKAGAATSASGLGMICWGCVRCTAKALDGESEHKGGHVYPTSLRISPRAGKEAQLKVTSPTPEGGERNSHSLTPFLRCVSLQS